MIRLFSQGWLWAWRIVAFLFICYNCGFLISSQQKNEILKNQSVHFWGVRDVDCQNSCIWVQRDSTEVRCLLYMWPTQLDSLASYIFPLNTAGHKIRKKSWAQNQEKVLNTTGYGYIEFGSPNSWICITHLFVGSIVCCYPRDIGGVALFSVWE